MRREKRDRDRDREREIEREEKRPQLGKPRKREQVERG